MLYRKYRPQTFAQVVGQDHVVKTLQGALETGRTGHAYLFCGPRGTGKTTMARILAKALNCEKYEGIDERRRGNTEASRLNVPCGVCASCQAITNGTSLDLIEIDAASQTGVDNIRELTDSAMVAASGGKHKIFLIDEVHMLSKSAFNALLKTLEEPPAHVMFILATTEPQKILATVLSRVQRFDFRRLSNADIVSKLKGIASAEKFSIDDEALAAIAASADGALRDAEVSLTKIRAMVPTGAITGKQVAQILGLIPSSYHPQFLSAILAGDKASAIALIHEIHDSGLDLENFAKEFLVFTRKALLSRINPATLVSIEGAGADQKFAPFATADQRKLIKIINLFTAARSQVKTSPIPQLPLELAVMEIE